MERTRDVQKAVVSRREGDVPTLAREAQRRLLEEADFQLRMGAGWLRSLEELLRLQHRTQTLKLQGVRAIASTAAPSAGPSESLPGVLPANDAARRGRQRLRGTGRQRQ